MRVCVLLLRRHTVPKMLAALAAPEIYAEFRSEVDEVVVLQRLTRSWGRLSAKNPHTHLNERRNHAESKK